MAKAKSFEELHKENTEACEKAREKYTFKVKVDDNTTLKFNISTETLNNLNKLDMYFEDSCVIKDLDNKEYTCTNKYQLEAIIRIITICNEKYNKMHFNNFMKIIKDQDVKFDYSSLKKEVTIDQSLLDDVYNLR